MPNWCDNDLHICAPTKSKLNIILNKLGCKENPTQLKLGSIVPEPRDLMEQNSELDNNGFSMPGWYNWRLANWGCKWDIGECQVTEDYAFDYYHMPEGWTRAIINFQSPWAPPSEWLHALAKKYPDAVVGLVYSEGGVGFEGELVLKGEDTLHSETRDIRPEIEYLLSEGMEE
jgi:hypothetical protein